MKKPATHGARRSPQLAGSNVLARLATQFPELDARDLLALAEGGDLRLPSADARDERIVIDLPARATVPVRHRA